MCGFAGIFMLDGSPVPRTVLSAMGDQISHRGPDQQGIWISGRVGLIHRRLSIRDLSEAGRQPITDQTGAFVTVWNGEIYNCEDRKAELEKQFGVAFKSSGDADLIANVFARQSADGLDFLNGMYSAAIYDKAEECLWLVRDPIGIKPLYLYSDPSGKGVAFASEVKAFLKYPGFRTGFDPLGIHVMLAQGHLGPERSLHPNVRSLAPGEVLRIDSRGKCISRQIRYRSSRAAANFGPGDPVSTLCAQLQAAVQRQRVSDRSLAVWQSGGIDSTLISGTCQSPAPQLINIAFGYADFDETRVAQQVADHMGTELRTVMHEETRSPAEEFASIVWHLDGHLADSSALAVARLSRATKDHAVVVLTGDGADEYFGGYSTYRATAISNALGQLVPRALSHCLSRLAFRAGASRQTRYPALELAGRFLEGLPNAESAHPHWRRYVMPWQIDGLYGAEMRHLAETNPFGEYCEAMQGVDGNIRVAAQMADQTYYLPSDMLMKTDRMSMMHGIEARVPLLDLEFLSQASTLSAELKLPQGKQTKPLLRKVVKSLGFDEEIFARKKTGLNVPLAHLLRTNYESLMRELLMETDSLSPYLNPDGVRRVCQAHLDGKANNAYAIWTLMTLSQWRRQCQ